jgi:DNA anti-recombination protein RmuC
MKTPFLPLAALACALLPMIACEKKDYDVKAAGPYYSRTDFNYDQRDQFRVEMQTASEKIESRLTQLKDDIARGTRSAKSETDSAIASLERGLDDLRKKLATTSSTARASWDDFKKDVTKSVDDLGRQIDRALTG